MPIKRQFSLSLFSAFVILGCCSLISATVGYSIEKFLGKSRNKKKEEEREIGNPATSESPPKKIEVSSCPASLEAPARAFKSPAIPKDISSLSSSSSSSFLLDSTKRVDAFEIAKLKNSISKRKFISLERWHSISRPQYKYSCGVSVGFYFPRFE